MQKTINITNYKSLALLGKTSLQLNRILEKAGKKYNDIFYVGDDECCIEASQIIRESVNDNRDKYTENLILLSPKATKQVDDFLEE